MKEMHSVFAQNDMLCASTMHPITAIHDWIAGHPVSTVFITIVIGILIAIFTDELKIVLRRWPMKTFYFGLRNNTEQRLAALTFLHRSVYNLLLFLSRTLLESLRTAVVWTVIFYAYEFYHGKVPDSPPWGALAGMSLYKLWETASILRQLQNYDDSVAKLSKRLEKSNNVLKASK